MREQRDQMRRATTAKVWLELAKSARVTVPGAINHRLQSPFARTEHDLLLSKPVKGTILAPNRGNLANVGSNSWMGYTHLFIVRQIREDTS
jgi:hypothetical protein